MRPPDASRDPSTKDQLQKNFPHARIISSNRWHALFLCRFSVQFSHRCRFLQNRGVHLASTRAGLLLPAPHSCPPRRTVAWTVASVGGELAEVHRPRERRQQHLLRLPERRSEGRRRPAPPTPPEAYAWPSSSPCVLQDSRHGLRGAEHALCRRRAREAVPSKAWSIAQVVPRLASGWDQ